MRMVGSGIFGLNSDQVLDHEVHYNSLHFTVLHVWLIISKSCTVKIKNNPIFGIYVKFPIEWWYSFCYLVKKSMRKLLPKLEEKQKKSDFFENRPGVKGLISKVKNIRLVNLHRKNQK